MPLDTSSYALALLRLDGRRWNELRRFHAQVSTQAAADGSSYLEMGNTKVICTVAGPAEGRRGAGGGGGSSSGGATIQVEIGIAGFSGIDRKRHTRGDKRVAEMQHTVTSAFASVLLTQMYPNSAIKITLHVLSQDGSLLAACLNAATLALVDAGIPMTSYLTACTVGSTLSSFSQSTGSTEAEVSDPLLDLNSLEEQELPFMTVATVTGVHDEQDKVSVCIMETRVRVEKVEEMLAVSLDGCKRIREIIDGIIRAHGKKMLSAVG